jgi:hypothetical protein
VLQVAPVSRSPLTAAGTLGRKVPWAAVGSVLGGTGAIAVHASRFGSWIVDDAAITFAYARSVADGAGPVLQPGADPVEAYSNPAWLALLALGRLVGLFDHGEVFGVPDYAAFPKAMALLCCAGILIACYRAASVLTRRPALVTWCAGLGLALIPSFVIWCFSGLENSLFALAVTALAALLCRAVVTHRLLTPKVAIIAGLLPALAALTRPDGLIYVAAFPLLAFLRVTRPTLGLVVRFSVLSGVAFGLPYGAYVSWRLIEFGQLLSMPAVAKGQKAPSSSTLSRVGEVIGYGGALAVLVMVACLGIVIMQPSRLRLGLVALLVPLSLALVAHSVLMPDWMGEQRFATPIWPLLVLVGTLAVGAALVQLKARARVVLAIALVIALIPSVASFRNASNTFRAGPTFPMCLVVERFAVPFTHYADLLAVQDGSVLLPDIGGTALAGRLKIVDLAGLAEPRIAEMRGANTIARELPDYIFNEVKPTFIHSHPGWTAGLEKDPRLSRDYVAIYNPNQDNANGDWVRRDAVHESTALEAARAYAPEAVGAAFTHHNENPRRSCGPALRP